MGIGCYSIDKPKSENSQTKIEITETKSTSFQIHSAEKNSSHSNLKDEEGKSNFDSTVQIVRPAGRDSDIGIEAANLDVKKIESKLHQRPILPNFPYSPCSSPHNSPELRSHIHSMKSLNHNGYSLHPKDTSAISNLEDSHRITKLNQYQIRQQLGQGSYGLVQLAYNNEDSAYYAMKSLSKKKLMKSSGLFNLVPPTRKSTSSVSSNGKKSTKPINPLQKIYKEIAFHKKLNHPNIVKLIEVLDDPSQEFLYMVFEYVENGPVMDVGKDSPFQENKARKYLIDTLLGLEYLHYQKIIHRDIKPANLLLSKNDIIKISDFGVSNEFTGDDVYLSSTAGSPAFMAPESVGNGDQCFTGKALDIWALGITLYAFLFGKVPFENCNRFLLYQMIISNPVLYPDNSSISLEVRDLLQRMLDKNPLTRIKLPEIKTHVWTTKNNSCPLLTEAENCEFGSIRVDDEEVANSIHFVPRLETVIKIKMLLKQKSFANPTIFGSASKLNVSKIESDLLKGPSPFPQRLSCDCLSPTREDKFLSKVQNHENH